MNGFQGNGPAIPDAWSRVPADIVRLLPDDYREFMLRHNGGHGDFPDHLISLEPIEGLEEWNRLVEVTASFPEGAVLIGSNGGGEWYGFFIHNGRTVFGQVPAIGMEPDTIWEIPMTFSEFISRPPAPPDEPGESIWPL